MILAIAQMDPTVQGILFLVAVILALLAAFNVSSPIQLFPLAFAFFAFVFMWNAFAAA